MVTDVSESINNFLTKTVWDSEKSSADDLVWKSVWDSVEINVWTTVWNLSIFPVRNAVNNSIYGLKY